jgi:glycosyltransferase involved in cell wall biosynthesis
MDGGVPEAKLRSCPLGVRTDLYRPDVRPLELRAESGRSLSSYAVRFLNVSELGVRKNLAGLLTAWLRATSSHDDAVLIWKVGCYYPGSLAAFEAEVRHVQQRIGIPLGQAAPIHFVYELFPDADMPRLFAAATHYMSLSFGEGWDLSMMQAAASGLRLIAPRHSAYLDYLDAGIASLVSAREQPAITESGSWISELFKGASWWVPDEAEAVDCIRRAVEGRDATAASARDRIAGRYTWEAAAKRLIEIIDEAEASPTLPRAG